MWRRLSRLRQRGAHGTDDWLEDFLHLSKQQTLLRFDTAGWRDRWSLHCDAEYGGSSTVELQQGEAEGEGTARFAGQTVTEIDSDHSSVSPETGKRAVYAGWAAMRTDVEGDGWDLKDFHGIRLRVRPDGRGYMLNLRTVGILGGEDVDIYQARMPPSPVLGDWCELRLPFSAFVLTWVLVANLTRRGLRLTSGTYRVLATLADFLVFLLVVPVSCSSSPPASLRSAACRARWLVGSSGSSAAARARWCYFVL